MMCISCVHQAGGRWLTDGGLIISQELGRSMLIGVRLHIRETCSLAQHAGSRAGVCNIHSHVTATHFAKSQTKSLNGSQTPMTVDLVKQLNMGDGQGLEALTRSPTLRMTCGLFACRWFSVVLLL